jgi:hypothetical protein
MFSVPFLAFSNVDSDARNQNALGGSIPTDTFQDAAALELLSEQHEDMWKDWPLLATDGDMVTLLQIVSENKVPTYPASTGLPTESFTGGLRYRHNTSSSR